MIAQDEEYKEVATDAGAEVNQMDTSEMEEVAEPIQDGLAEELDMTETLEKIRSLREE